MSKSPVIELCGVSTNFRGKAVHRDFQCVPEFGESFSTLLPGIFAPLFDIGLAHALLDRTQVGLAVDDRNVDEPSQSLTPVRLI